jgi:hypothetical protein
MFWLSHPHPPPCLWDSTICGQNLPFKGVSDDLVIKDREWQIAESRIDNV